MLTPIVCSCGMSLGDIAVLYETMLRDSKLHDESVMPFNASIDVGHRSDVEQIYKKLHVKNICCRSRLSNSIAYLDKW